jgi:hypothetical protein
MRLIACIEEPDVARKILEHLGLQVNRLIRLSFGPFQLGDIPEGAVEEGGGAGGEIGAGGWFDV